MEKTTEVTLEETMQPPLPRSTPTGAPTSPDTTLPPNGDPIPILVGQLSTLLRKMEAPPPFTAEELKELTQLLRALHRQNTTLISRPRASLPWPQLVILTSVPVLLVLLILTFLRPSWLSPQEGLLPTLKRHQPSSVSQQSPRSTSKP
jgi:hypothetical protein